MTQLSNDMQVLQTEEHPCAARTCRIAVTARPDGPVNPYSRQFYKALEEQGLWIVEGLEFTDVYLREHAADYDCIHLQWIEYCWARKGSPVLARLRSIAGLWKYLQTARRLNKKVMLTIHNTEPHESFDWVDRIGYRLAVQNSDLIICHSRKAAELIRRRDKPTGRVVVMYHGNYAGEYPVARDTRLVRSELGFDPDHPLVSCLGVLRDYKGFDVACEAIRLLGGKVQLLIAGEPFEDYSLEALQNDLYSLPGSRLVPRRLSEQEYADYMSASDLILLPYEQITGSGALLAAWSMERCVVASELEFFAEMRQIAGAGLQLFSPGDAESLAETIDLELRRRREDREQSARSAAARFRWTDCVSPVVDVITAWHLQTPQRLGTCGADSNSH